jgi:hypothetical protein
MAITTTILRETVYGDNRVIFGKSVLSGSSSSETIVTGLSQIDNIQVNVKSATPAYISPTDDYPIASGSAVVKVSANDQTLYWAAFGK